MTYEVWSISFFDEETRSVVIVINQATVNVNEVLDKKLYKPVIKKFKKLKVFLRFKDNIWAACSADMESLSSINRRVKYLLCVIDVLIQYAWVKRLTNKEARTVLNDFIGIVNQSKRKPNYELI